MEPRDGCLRQKMGWLFRLYFRSHLGDLEIPFFFSAARNLTKLGLVGIIWTNGHMVGFYDSNVLSIYAKVLIERNHGVSDGFLEEFPLSKQNTSPLRVCKLRNVN